jgi:hypothetical protein
MDVYFNFENVGKEIAVIKSDKMKDKSIYFSLEKDSINHSLEKVEVKKPQMLQLVPDMSSERVCLFVAGMSGSGKSYWTSKYVTEYKKRFKNNKIYLISPITDDKSINGLNPIRINPKSQQFIDDPPTVEDFKDSLLICDDIEAYDKKIVASIMSIINSILTTGRHYKSSIVFLAHQATNGNMTRLLLSECHSITLFTATMTGKSSKYLLDQYLGLSKEQIKKIKNVKSRAITIVRSYPMLLISESEIIPLNQF